MAERVQGRTWAFARPPAVVAHAAVMGPKEGQGPLGDTFDEVTPDDMLGESSFERAERRYFLRAAHLALDKAGITPSQVDVLVGGDLLNQTITANFAARDLAIPYLGLYAACATFAGSLALAAVLVDGGYADTVLCATASHHSASERQYRYPTELGVQRLPTSQWTATGGAAAVVRTAGSGAVSITHATVGVVRDRGVKDPNHMGAAMAPAALDTLSRHLADTGRKAEDYDLVVTGDLGRVGVALLEELLQTEGRHLGSVTLQDCGVLLYSKDQDVHSGGSGSVCSAAVLAGYLLPGLEQGRWRRLLLLGTGSLHSPTSYQQGENVPGIAHAVALERRAQGGGDT